MPGAIAMQACGNDVLAGIRTTVATRLDMFRSALQKSGLTRREVMHRRETYIAGGVPHRGVAVIATMLLAVCGCASGFGKVGGHLGLSVEVKAPAVVATRYGHWEIASPATNRMFCWSRSSRAVMRIYRTSVHHTTFA